MTILKSVVTNSEKQINLNLNENLIFIRVCFIKILIIPKLYIYFVVFMQVLGNNLRCTEIITKTFHKDMLLY